MPEELIVREEAQGVARTQAQPADLLAVVARAAADPSVDVDKMKALLDMQERLMKIGAEREFKEALSAVQAASPRVERDGKIIVKGALRSTYATFEAIDRELRPLISEHGFAYRFTTDPIDAKTLKMTMTVSHRAGHSEVAAMPLPIDSSEYRSAVQNSRSTITYAKRCLVSDFFNVVTVGEDDDGSGGYVSKDQVMNIEALLSETGVSRSGFLKFASVNSVERIPARDYEKCIRALESRRK